MVSHLRISWIYCSKRCECALFPIIEEIEKFLSENCVNGDLLITMGAGNVVEIGEDLLKK